MCAFSSIPYFPFRFQTRLKFGILFVCVCVYFHALDKAWYLTIINKQVRLYNSFCSGNYLCRRCFVYEGIFTLYSISDLDNQYRNNVHHRCKIMATSRGILCNAVQERTFVTQRTIIARPNSGDVITSSLGKGVDLLKILSFIDEKSLQIYIALKFGHI